MISETTPESTFTFDDVTIIPTSIEKSGTVTIFIPAIPGCSSFKMSTTTGKLTYENQVDKQNIDGTLKKETSIKLTLDESTDITGTIKIEFLNADNDVEKTTIISVTKDNGSTKYEFTIVNMTT